MNFDVARIIAKTIKLEGGDKYTEDRQDPGGATKYGICKRYHPNEDIKNLTLERAQEIYFKEYYEPLGFEGTERLDYRWYLFDCAVIPGPAAAKRWKAETATWLPDYDTTLEKLKDLRCECFVDRVAHNPKLRKYLNGWIRRASDLGAELA